MNKRNRWIAGGALLVAVMLGAWFLASSDEVSSALGLSDDSGRSWASSVLGGSSAREDAGGSASAEALGSFDGGFGAGAPFGVWLPTATIAEDPSSPYGSLTGRVLSSVDGDAIEGAELVFLREGTSSSVRSRSDGTFTLRASASGRYVLAIASAEGFLPYAPEWGHSAIAFEARATQRIEGVVVHLTPLVQRDVEVVDAEGGAVAGATVELLGADSGERTMAPVQSNYTADDEGRVTGQSWPGAMAEARHEAHGVGRVRLAGRRRAGEVARIVLGPPDPHQTSGGALGGVVVDTGGQPIEGALVTAYRQQQGLHPSSQGTSDEQGRFEIAGLDLGSHMLVATHPAHPRAYTRGVETGRHDARITMRSGASLTGQVVDQDGAPLPAFTVIARAVRGALVRQNVASVSSYDAGGRFEFAGLAPGELELIATARGYPPSAPVPVTVRASGASSVRITVRRGGRISGVIRSADGSPVQGATVSLEGRLGSASSAVPLLARGVSDGQGRYSLEGIGETLSSVRVHADGFHSRILAGLAIPPGEQQTLDVELTPVEEGETSRTELVGIGAVLMPRGDTLVIRRVVPG
ncbi:MAG TPA: carboxypeptidase regulatory-like domain-containing protein, partial [Polyangiaceae bacterium]|nr:carboxypeptidase regulatory-like domain-containing protein [Polyangiaceae bacterium]